MTKREKKLKKLLEIIDWLQENTDLAERLEDISDEKTENNPAGDYARIERWLTNNNNSVSLLLDILD